MKLTRLYCDADGESHFEDVDVAFELVDFAPPAPARQIMFYLAGEIEAEVSDGEIRRFGPGSVTLVEDTTGRGHTSRVVGDTEALLAVVQLPD